MNETQKPRWSRCLFSIIFACLSIFLNGCKDFEASEKKEVKKTPNILFISVDDLNDWTGFLEGHPQAYTPNMDKLAAQGLVFERAYTAAPACNPSRAAILSGYRPSTSGVYQNGQEMFEVTLIQNSLMMPQYFSKYGYKTFSRGKVYHEHLNGNHTWDVWENISGTYGEPNIKEGFLENGIPKGEMPNNMDWAGVDIPIEETKDYLNAKWAADLLFQEHDKPFFIGLGIYRPHLKWRVPKEFFDLFVPDSLEMPKILQTDLEDVGNYKEATSEYKTIKKYGKEREAVRAYLANIAYADHCVGVVLDALEKSPYFENTIVVLWGDHGWHLGEKLRYKKFTLWEEACRVPLIIKAPGLTTSKSRTGRTVNLIDLYPTLLELAGLPQNTKNDGRSLLPLLKDSDVEWDYPSLTQNGEGENSIRTERWRYIRYRDGSEELYDHKTDSLEWRNLARQTDYKNIKDELSMRLDQMLHASKNSN